MSRANSLICTTASVGPLQRPGGGGQETVVQHGQLPLLRVAGHHRLDQLDELAVEGRSRAVQAMLNARWRLAIEPMSMVFSQNGKRNRALPAYRTTRKKTEPMMLKKR